MLRRHCGHPGLPGRSDDIGTKTGKLASVDLEIGLLGAILIGCIEYSMNSRLSEPLYPIELGGGERGGGGGGGGWRES